MTYSWKLTTWSLLPSSPGLPSSMQRPHPELWATGWLSLDYCPQFRLAGGAPTAPLFEYSWQMPTWKPVAWSRGHVLAWCWYQSTASRESKEQENIFWITEFPKWLMSIYKDIKDINLWFSYINFVIIVHRIKIKQELIYNDFNLLNDTCANTIWYYIYSSKDLVAY